MFKLKFLLSTLLLFSQLPLTSVERIDVRNKKESWISTFNLEHATTESELSWGLMQRENLQKNWGLSFNFKHPRPLSFWMFGCLIDLSLAFCDENHVIREIYDMKAYPDKMDPNRPIHKLADLSQYSDDDPVVAFFIEKSVHSKNPTNRAFEVPINWFRDNKVSPGDVAVWHVLSNDAFISHTLDVSEYSPTEDNPILLIFPGGFPHSLWRPQSETGIDVAFYSDKYEVLIKSELAGGKNLPVEEVAVVFSGRAAKYALLAPIGTMEEKSKNSETTVDRAIFPYPTNQKEIER